MRLEPANLAAAVSWAATAVGIGLWLWSWFGARDRILKLRFYDCGMVLVFTSVLLRVLVVRGPPFNGLDWLLLAISPVFIAAALWRLGRTGPSQNGSH
jgi:hypothetical protein